MLQVRLSLCGGFSAPIRRRHSSVPDDRSPAKRVGCCGEREQFLFALLTMGDYISLQINHPGVVGADQSGDHELSTVTGAVRTSCETRQALPGTADEKPTSQE